MSKVLDFEKAKLERDLQQLERDVNDPNSTFWQGYDEWLREEVEKDGFR